MKPSSLILLVTQWPMLNAIRNNDFFQVFVVAVAVLTTTVVVFAHLVGLPYWWHKSPTITICLVIFGYWLLINVTFHYYMAVVTPAGCPPDVSHMIFLYFYHFWHFCANSYSLFLHSGRSNCTKQLVYVKNVWRQNQHVHIIAPFATSGENFRNWINSLNKLKNTNWISSLLSKKCSQDGPSLP